MSKDFSEEVLAILRLEVLAILRENFEKSLQLAEATGMSVAEAGEIVIAADPRYKTARQREGRSDV